MIDFDTFTKMPKNVGDLGRFIAAKGFKNLPKVQKIAQSGHTDCAPSFLFLLWFARLHHFSVDGEVLTNKQSIYFSDVYL